MLACWHETIHGPDAGSTVVASAGDSPDDEQWRLHHEGGNSGEFALTMPRQQTRTVVGESPAGLRSAHSAAIPPAWPRREVALGEQAAAELVRGSTGKPELFQLRSRLQRLVSEVETLLAPAKK